MNKNKKGLSTIVATLLIILLTLVAVGIIWVVVRNVITGGSNQVTIDSKCIQANVIATKVLNNTATNFTVTLSRQGGGNDEIGGVKLVFSDAGDTVTSVQDAPGNIDSLSTVVRTVTIDSTLTNPSKVSVVVYFLDDSGNAQLCTSSNEFNF